MRIEIEIRDDTRQEPLSVLLVVSAWQVREAGGRLVQDNKE